MRIPRRWLAAAATASALAAGAACSDRSAAPLPRVDPTPRVTGAVSIQGCTPARSLIPADVTDECGTRVLDPVMSRLVRLDAQGKVTFDLATSIDTVDNTTFTVRLAKGRRFHDGTEVKARNFVSAWNHGAYGPNALAGRDQFAAIAGAQEVGCRQDCPTPQPRELSGLTIIDDQTFTIRLTRPITDFVPRLASLAYAPLPDSFFAEPGPKTAYLALPVGAGPFRIARLTSAQAELERFDDYTGPDAARIRTATIWYYDDPARGMDAQKAYDDVVANRLDFTAVVPSDMLTDDQWVTDLPGRQRVVATRTPVILTFLGSDPALRDNPQLRRAISRAIDRPTLTRRIFQNTRTPATSWVSPAVTDYQQGACGDLCTFDLAAARDLYARSGGYPGEFTVTVNGDGANKEWADALCNQLKTNLSMNCQVTVLPNQRAVLAAAEKKSARGLVRQGWQAGTTSPVPDLARHRFDHPLDLAAHHDEIYDALLDRADAAATREEGLRVARQAEDRLVLEPPSIPLWSADTPIAWSNRITDVELNAAGQLDLTRVRVR